MTALQKTLDEFTSKLTELENAKEKVETAEAKATKAAKEFTRLEAQLKAAKAEVEAAKTEAASKVDASKAELEAAKTEAASKVDASKAELEAAKAEVEVAKTEVEAAKTEVEAAKTEVEAAKTEATKQMRIARETMSAAIKAAGLEAQYQTTEQTKQIQELQTKIESLLNMEAMNIDEIQTQKNNIDELNKTIQAAEQSATYKDEELSSFKATIEALENQLGTETHRQSKFEHFLGLIAIETVMHHENPNELTVELSFVDGNIHIKRDGCEPVEQTNTNKKEESQPNCSNDEKKKHVEIAMNMVFKPLAPSKCKNYDTLKNQFDFVVTQKYDGNQAAYKLFQGKNSEQLKTFITSLQTEDVKSVSESESESERFVTFLKALSQLPNNNDTQTNNQNITEEELKRKSLVQLLEINNGLGDCKINDLFERVLCSEPLNSLIQSLFLILKGRVNTILKIHYPTPNQLEQISDDDKQAAKSAKSFCVDKTSQVDQDVNKIQYANNEYVFNEIMYPTYNNDVCESTKNSELKSEYLNSQLQQVVDKGDKVAIFNYGYSGSGKTYTTLNNTNDDTGILIKFIETNKDNINKIEINGVYGKRIGNDLYYGTVNFGENFIDKDSITNFDISNLNDMRIQYLDAEKNNFTSVSPGETIVKKKKSKRDWIDKSKLIKQTLNNPTSSRFHLSIKVIMKPNDQSNQGGELLYYDLAGSEDLNAIIKACVDNVACPNDNLIVDTLSTLIEKGSGGGIIIGKQTTEKNEKHRQLKYGDTKKGQEQTPADYFNTLINPEKQNTFTQIFGNTDTQNIKNALIVIRDFLQSDGKKKMNSSVSDDLDIILESQFINTSLQVLKEYITAFKTKEEQQPTVPNSEKFTKMFGHNIDDYDKILVFGFIRTDKKDGTQKTLNFLDSIHKGNTQLGGGPHHHHRHVKLLKQPSPSGLIENMAVTQANRATEDIVSRLPVMSGAGLIDTSVQNTDRALFIGMTFVLAGVVMYVHNVVSDKGYLKTPNQSIAFTMGMYSSLIMLYNGLIGVDTMSSYYMSAYLFVFLMTNASMHYDVYNNAKNLIKMDKNKALNKKDDNEPEAETELGKMFLLTWAIVSVGVIML